MMQIKGPTLEPPTSSTDSFSTSSITVDTIATMLGYIIALLVLILGTTKGSDVLFRNQKPLDINQTIESRISTLTNSLQDAVGLISEVEQEISKRQQLVEKLQRDANEAKKLSELNSPQVAAVAQALRGELHNESQSSFWVNASLNLFYALAGALFGELFRRFRK